MEYEKEVRKFLCQILGNPQCETLDPKADLAPCGMDSLNCISLIIALEEAFDMEVPMEKLGMRFVCSVQSICQLVEEVKGV